MATTRRGHVRAEAASLSAAAPIFTALGDETRLALMSRLCRDGPLSISRLAASTPLTRQAVTKHLAVLADAGLARSERRGREQHWRVDPSHLADVRRLLAQISAQWDDALDRLAEFVARGRR